MEQLIKSARELLDAINANLKPIKGTNGITELREVPTGAYVRLQFISEEMENLLNVIEGCEAQRK
jgi:hypothetical protein